MKNIKVTSTNIDIIRVSVLFLVVLYHCTSYYSNDSWPFKGPDSLVMTLLSKSFSAVRMPIYTFISGYLFFMLKNNGKYNKIKSFLYGKIKRIIVPYIIWSLVVILFFSQFYTLRNIFSGVCHLWFLLMLFWMFLLAPTLNVFMNNQTNTYVQVAIFSTTLLFGYLLHSFHYLCFDKTSIVSIR